MKEWLIMSKQKKSSFLGIIPARAGSQAIPHKNLVKLAGQPLIAYTFKAASASRTLDRIILTTDDPEIASLGEKYKINVPFMRPEELAQNDSTLEDVMLHALDWLKENEHYIPDAVVLLQATSPLRTTEHIDQAIELFEKESVESLVSVSPPMEHPCDMVYFTKENKIKFLLKEGGFLEGKQRQDYPLFYFLNGAIYIFRTEVLRKYRSRFGRSVVPYIMSQLDSIDVDSLDDLHIAELIISHRKCV
ncbi:MAG: cytidylyltransferase domain-containing protein [bacterium]